MAELLFRDEVIEASRDRLTGTVVAAVPPSSRLYTRLTLLVVVALLLFLVFGHYTMTTDVRGIVAYDAGVARVYPRGAAEVAEIHVRQGDRVAAGQPVATLTVAQGVGGMRPMLNEVASQDAELARQLELVEAQAQTQRTLLEHKRSALTSTIASLTRQSAFANDQIELAEAALARAQRLAGEGAGTQRQVEDSRSALLQRRADLEALREELSSQRSALLTNESERTQLDLDSKVSGSELASRRSQLSEQRQELERNNRLVLVAPIDGIVGDVSVGIGQRADPERSVVSIIPDDAELEIWLYAPSRAVGNARSGQQVRLLFDAFPHQKYGWGTGFVTDIAQVPTEPGNLDPGLAISEPVFRIRTDINSLSDHSDLRFDALRPGMTITGKLEQDSRNLWQVFLHPIIEAIAE